VSGFETVPEQHEAKRLLAAALQEGPAHAYLFHGPAGVGKRELARRFAAELLGDHARVERGTHPDLYLLEPLGEQIRIDDVRELRRDLHMRPFEAERRVYLVFGADSLNGSDRCPRRSVRAASSCPSGACRSPPCDRRSTSTPPSSARRS